MGKKIVIIGAGSPYVPAIVHEIALNCKKDIIDEMVFVTHTNLRLNTIANFCEGLLRRHGINAKITQTISVDESIKNADIIILIYRVGGLLGRKEDEMIGIDLGVISQESQGVGGFSSALRNIYLLQELTPVFKKYAPDAWIINLTNPTGIMTCAAHRLGLKSIGICDAPYDLEYKIAEWIGESVENLQFDFIGLNHLGWMIDIQKDNLSLMENVFSDDSLRNLLIKLLPEGIEFTEDYLKFIQAISAIPTSYVAYYYYKNAIIEFQRNRSGTRADVVQEINTRLFAKYEACDYEKWPDYFKNERAGYLLGKSLDNVVCDILESASSEKEYIVCMRNGDTVLNISSDVVLEMPVRISNGKIIPKNKSKLIHGNLYSLMAAVSEYEQMTVTAALSGDKGIALQALATHPLVPTIEIANILLGRILEKHKAYLPQFER